MYLFKTLSRAAGLGLCVVAFAGTAFADPGNGNGNPPATPPGQEKRADQPAPAPAPPAAPGQEKRAQAPGQQKKAEKAESKSAKSAKAATPTKAQAANAHHHVIICHRTGSLTNPYVVINIPWTAWMHAHSDTTGSHPDLNGNHDIMLKDPASRPGSKDGFAKAACKSSTTPFTTQATPPAQNVTQPPSNAVTPGQPQPIVPTASAATAAPVGGVAGAVSPANASAAEQEQPAGGVLGAIASAPEAVAETATSGTLPFTGIPLWIAALIGGALLATGLVLRRASV